MRISKLQGLLSDKGIDGVIINDEYNMRYYTSYTGGTGYLVISSNNIYIVTDSRYVEQAEIECPRAICIDVANKGYPRFIADICGDEHIKTLGFEDDSMGYSQFVKLEKTLEGIELSPAGELIKSVRRIKDSTELECIRTAEAIGDAAFSHIIGYIKQGVTEQDIAIELEYYMKRHEAEALSFDTIVASGTHSSLPHANVTSKAIENGDFITMDFGCVYKGYCSDMTRTVAVGGISKEQENIYDIVLEAQEAALAAVGPGKNCKVIDAIARDIIRDAGYGEYFGHGLGDSVGLYIHEEPRLSPGCSELLVPGMTMTVEPGIYLPGKFGVRIEDLVAITNSGYDNFTASDKTLTIL